jgi:hypothetical protein
MSSEMGRLNPIERRIERFLREPPTIRNAAGVIVTATLLWSSPPASSSA